jgi:hypothetical protein
MQAPEFLLITKSGRVSQLQPVLSFGALLFGESDFVDEIPS